MLEVEVRERDDLARILEIRSGGTSISTPAILTALRGELEISDPESGRSLRLKLIDFFEALDSATIPEGSMIEISPFPLTEDFLEAFDDALSYIKKLVDRSSGIVIPYVDGGLVDALVERLRRIVRGRRDLVIHLGQSFKNISRNPRAAISLLLSIKENLPLEIPIVLGGFKDPREIPVAIYLGVDIIDAGSLELIDSSGKASLGHGELVSAGTISSSYSRLRGIVVEMREAIRRRLSREIAESYSTFSSESFRLLRISDLEFYERIERFVARDKPRISCISPLSFDRPEVRSYIERFEERYWPPSHAEILLILPCSKRKPYSSSRTHRELLQILRGSMSNSYIYSHEVIITSPLGLVPRELETIFPAMHYDTPVTGYWSEDELERSSSMLREYLRRSRIKIVILYAENGYGRIVEHIPGDYDLILARDREELRRECSRIASDYSPSTEISWEDREREMLRSLARFQFGIEAGEKLIDDRTKVRGRQILDEDGRILATLSGSSGSLALTLAGAERIVGHGYDVELNFYPETSKIYVGGIVRAGEEIRRGDEVVLIYEESVIGVGRALMSQAEMMGYGRGAAIKVRHRARRED